MYLKETVKKTFEAATGYAKPTPRQARQAVRDRKAHEHFFADDGQTPNNSVLPFIHYRSPVRFTGGLDPAAILEGLFDLNGWRDAWRNGIYDYLHYHSRIHEVLGVARGSAQVRFGGDSGKILSLRAGDVAILPAGTGHQLLSASADFLVVGAYPAQGTYDECTGTTEEHARALKSNPKVAIPARDPVYGKDGGLTKLWRRRQNS